MINIAQQILTVGEMLAGRQVSALTSSYHSPLGPWYDQYSPELSSRTIRNDPWIPRCIDWHRSRPTFGSTNPADTERTHLSISSYSSDCYWAKPKYGLQPVINPLLHPGVGNVLNNVNPNEMNIDRGKSKWQWSAPKLSVARGYPNQVGGGKTPCLTQIQTYNRSMPIFWLVYYVGIIWKLNK